MCEYGELGEFNNEFSMTEELADPFFEPESYSLPDDQNDGQIAKELENVCSRNCCVNMIHYA